MTFINTVPDDDASGDVAELYAEFDAVPNYVKAFSHRPAVLAAWQQLLGAIKSTMDPRRYELATVAAARTVRSSYCMLAHGSVLADEFLGPEQTRAVALDHHTADLDPIDIAVMDLAQKVAADATSVTQDDVDKLRSLGLHDGEIFDVVAAAAARCFLTKTVDGLGAQPDPSYADLEPELRDALTVGRPIAQA